MSRDEALNYHQGWSDVTRDYVRGELERIGATRFLKDVHGYWNSVKVTDDTGTFLADLMKTKVWFATHVAPAGAEPGGSYGHLSVMLEGVTRADRSARTVSRPEPEPTFCPNHPGLALPASGVCDYC